MINFYYNILDKKIQNGSLLVLIITSFIIFVGLLFSPTKKNVMSVNVINSQKYVTINGESYKITLDNLK